MTSKLTFEFTIQLSIKMVYPLHFKNALKTRKQKIKATQIII